MDSVNSTTFIKRPPCMTDTQEKFLYTKELLSGRIFLGSYLEKRYVSVLKEYRDVVFINADETDLQHDLNKIRKKWLGVNDLKWVGITGPDEFGFPKAYCFWVKLTNVAIGQYWFQIKRVKLIDQEVVFQLRCIRKFQTPVSAVTLDTCDIKKSKSSDEKNERSETSMVADSTSTGLIGEFEPQKALSSLQETCTEAIQTIRPFLTVTNFITAIKVGSALTIALVMGVISLIGHLGEYTLKLIREFSLLVHAFTPIVIQLIDFLSKIIGGLFILIAGMMRGGNQIHPSAQPYRNQILYNTSGAPNQPTIDWRERNRILRQQLFTNPPKAK